MKTKQTEKKIDQWKPLHGFYLLIKRKSMHCCCDSEECNFNGI